MTAATLAGNFRVVQASTIACKLVPLPLINMTSRQGSDRLTNDNASMAFDAFADHQDFLSEFFQYVAGQCCIIFFHH